MIGSPPNSTLFPYPTLFRSKAAGSKVSALYSQAAAFEPQVEQYLRRIEAARYSAPPPLRLLRSGGGLHPAGRRRPCRGLDRSEERRVGKERRSRWAPH